MLHTDGYKLVTVHGHQFGELYDLQDALTETHNRWIAGMKEENMKLTTNL